MTAEAGMTSRFIKSRGQTYTVPTSELEGVLTAYETWAETRGKIPTDLFLARTRAICFQAAPATWDDPYRPKRLLAVMRSTLASRVKGKEPPKPPQQELVQSRSEQLNLFEE